MIDGRVNRISQRPFPQIEPRISYWTPTFVREKKKKEEKKSRSRTNGPLVGTPRQLQKEILWFKGMITPVIGETACPAASQRSSLAD